MITELPISKMFFCCLFTLQVLKQSQDISGHIILKKHQSSFIFCLADSHFSMGGGGIVYSVSTQTPHLPPRSSDIFCPQGSRSSSLLCLSRRTNETSKEKPSLSPIAKTFRCLPSWTCEDHLLETPSLGLLKNFPGSFQYP